MNTKLLHEILSYCPETGIFRWKINRPPRGKAGDIAGYNNGSGYIKISIKGKRYYAHRLAFVYMGQPEPKIVDHINRVPYDNSWANLRAVTQKENNLNRAATRGIRKRYGKWYARISDKHIGVFDTEEDAYRAYSQCRDKVLSEFVQINETPDNLIVKKWNHKKRLFNGKSLSQISKEHGIKQSILYYRIYKKNMTIEQALTKDSSTTSGD
jgi:hypothetical protein